MSFPVKSCIRSVHLSTSKERKPSLCWNKNHFSFYKKISSLHCWHFCACQYEKPCFIKEFCCHIVVCLRIQSWSSIVTSTYQELGSGVRPISPHYHKQLTRKPNTVECSHRQQHSLLEHGISRSVKYSQLELG